MTTDKLTTALETLRASRTAAAAIKAAITSIEAPHKEAIVAATGALRAAAKQHEEAAAAAAATASAAWTAANTARYATLVAGQECPPIPLPTGCSVRELPALKVTVEDLPEAFFAPDMTKIKAAAKAGAAIPGVTVTTTPSFVFRSGN